MFDLMLLSHELRFSECRAQGMMRGAIEAWRWKGIRYNHACGSVIQGPQVFHKHRNKVARTMDARKHSILMPELQRLSIGWKGAQAMEVADPFGFFDKPAHQGFCSEWVNDVDLVSI